MTPIEVVQQVYAALARNDLPACLTHLAPDVVVRQTDQLPWGGTYQGIAAVPQFLGRVFGAIQSRVAVDRMFLAGDVVVVVGATEGTVIATGRPFRCDLVHLWTVRDGKITRFEVHIDTPAMQDALSPAIQT